MSGINLRAWLLRLPHPTSIRLDGKTKVVIGDGKSRWKDALEVIADAQAGKVEALNEAGDVLRVTRLEYNGDGNAAGSDAAEDGKKAPRGAITSDVLIELARLLNEAHDAGAARAASAYQANLGFQTQMTQVLTDRLTGLENAWQETLEERAAELRAEIPPEVSSDPAGSMLAHVVSMAAAKAERAQQAQPKPAAPAPAPKPAAPAPKPAARTRKGRAK